MSSLSAILPEIYPVITLNLNVKQDRFLRHLAQMANMHPNELAASLLVQQLEIEAAVLVDILNSANPDTPPPAPNDMNLAEPQLTVPQDHGPLITDEEFEEAARERHELGN